MIYKYALKLTKLPKNDNKCSKNEKTSKYATKCKIKVSAFQYLFHKTNYIFGKHYPEKKMQNPGRGGHL